MDKEIDKEILNIITETANQAAAATVDEAIEKMSSFSWIERIKAISNDYFTSTEKLLYAYPALQSHLMQEDEYFAMAFHSSAGSIVKFSKYKVAKPEEEQILKDRKESYNRSKSDLEKIEKALESIKNEINSTADSNIYYVTEETDGRKILQIKPKVQFQVDLAGIMKNSKPEEKEIESLNKKAPNKAGIWISEQSRDKFIDLLNKNNIDNLSIKKDGYLKVDKTSENEIAKNLEKMIKSDKLYIINITGVAYERDYISGEIVEYPFEDMDPEQVVEFYENGNKKILEITTNKKQELLDKEILEEITLY